MATVVHRLTAQPTYSANTPSYPEADYIINPDLSALSSVPTKYWKVVGDLVLEMDAGEKAAVDTAELSALWDALESNIEKAEFKAVIAALVKTINIRLPSNKITAAELKTAIRAEIEAG